MRRIHPTQHERLFGAQATRQIEQRALATLPEHSLMARAGQAVARLARAVAPHARTVWVACGPGNNGGDGLVAATHLLQQAQASGAPLLLVVTLCADPRQLPADAAWALTQALVAGVRLHDDPPATFDLAIDALLGIGRLRRPEGRLADHLQRLQDSTAPVLCVDLPSGLEADTGTHWAGPRRDRPPGERHTLSLLTLKPGLFTADGRDQAGHVWLDELGVSPEPSQACDAWLWAGELAHTPPAHATHKGCQGDVVVIGGQDIAVSGAGMTGAAVLAARAALHAGAGRVYVCPLEAPGMAPATGWDPACPELMWRRWAALASDGLLEQATVVCGCGGGQAVATVLPTVLARAHTLVLDADGLNAVAADDALQHALRQRSERGRTTVLTPHPLEAARLLGNSTAQVMADRLAAARQLSERWGAISVLKGSGSIVSVPGEVPLINASGNAALATAGTGDVLAGMIGAALARDEQRTAPWLTVAQAVHRHGWLADRWVARVGSAATARLTAGALALGALPG